MTDTSSICVDCGIDTCPCTGKRGCRHKGKWEHYMVHNRIWKQAGLTTGYICVGCLETRLGRQLHAGDFTAWPINNLDNPWDTERLADRRRRTTG